MRTLVFYVWQNNLHLVQNIRNCYFSITMAEDKGRYREPFDKTNIPKGRNHLLAVGIDEYVHHRRLYNAVKDTCDLIKVLTEHYDFVPEHIVKLTNAQATRKEILRALKMMAERVATNDNLLIYFSGHGHLDKLTRIGYWVPVDAEHDEADYIPNDQIHAYLKSYQKAQHVLLLSDSCFSGTLFGSATKGIATERAWDELYRYPSRYAITSGREEVVSDGEPGTNSPFAGYLLKYLRENAQGPFSAFQLAEQVRIATTNNSGQAPRIGPLQGLGDEGGAFVFVPRRSEERLWESTRGRHTLTAYMDYLEQYPTGEHVAEAKAAIAELERQRKAAEAQKVLERARRNRSLSELLDFESRYGQAAPELLDQAKALRKQLIAEWEQPEPVPEAPPQLPPTAPDEDSAAWEEAKRLNNESAYNAYTGRFPYGKYVNEANNAIRQIRAEREAAHRFEQAKTRRDRELLKDFINRYPESPQVAEARQLLEKLAHAYEEEVNGVRFKMIFVEGGTFQMGDTFGDGNSDEKPVHEVSLDSYYIGETPVTQALWKAVMGNNPSYFKNCDECPVEQVSWEDAQEFIRKLNSQTGKRYRLLTEAEWEYAARERGRKVRFGNGQDILRPSEANFDASAPYKKAFSVAGEYRGKTTPVKSFRPNSLGLYDMSGNVWEWCEDWYDAKFYASATAKEHNSINKSRTNYRVLRGGSWYRDSDDSRAANRDGDNPANRGDSVGFRLAAPVN